MEKFRTKYSGECDNVWVTVPGVLLWFLSKSVNRIEAA